jgi:hypothetical protein
VLSNGRFVPTDHGMRSCGRLVGLVRSQDYLKDALASGQTNSRFSYPASGRLQNRSQAESQISQIIVSGMASASFNKISIWSAFVGPGVAPYDDLQFAPAAWTHIEPRFKTLSERSSKRQFALAFAGPAHNILLHEHEFPEWWGVYPRPLF